MTDINKGRLEAFKEMRLVLADEFREDMIDSLEEQYHNHELSMLNYRVSVTIVKLIVDNLKDYLDNELAMRELIYGREDKLKDKER